MLRLSSQAHAQLVGHALDGLPDEACGLLIGNAELNQAQIFYPTGNAAASSKVYSIPPKDFLAADRAADAANGVIIGVVHSHTHTDAYPSPTDVEMAPDPDWHYVIVTLRDEAPMVRSYRIVDGTISEEPIRLDR